MPLPLLFIVLPVIFHERTCAEVTSTRLSSGARKFEEKFRNRGDLLFALNQRATALRPLSLRSMRHALAAGLVSVLPERGALWPRSYAKPPIEAKPVSELLAAADKLGAWCRSLSVYEISGILRIEF